MQTDIYLTGNFLPEGENIAKGYLQGRGMGRFHT